MAFSSGQYKQKLQSKKGKVNQIKYKLKIYAYTDKKKMLCWTFCESPKDVTLSASLRSTTTLI